MSKKWGSFIGVYFCSLLLTACNKTLLNKHSLPMSLTFFNLAIVSIVLVGWRAFFLRRQRLRVLPYRSASRQESLAVSTLMLLAACTAADVGMSAFAISRLPLSAVTVVKSGGVVLTFLWGVGLGIEKFSWKMLSVCFFIFSTVACALPWKEETLDAHGIFFLFFSVFFASLRWVLIQKELISLTPLDLLVKTQPLSALFILPLAIPEGYKSIDITQDIDAFAICILMAAPIFAFGLMYCEFIVVEKTSSLTLYVSGILRELTTLLMSVFMFNEELSSRQTIAISASICGLFLYAKLRNQSSNPKIRGYLRDLQDITAIRE